MKNKLENISNYLSNAQISKRECSANNYIQFILKSLEEMAKQFHIELLNGLKVDNETGFIYCSLDIEGKCAKNKKLIKALSSLPCWIEIDETRKRNNGIRMIFYKAKPGECERDIAKEVVFFYYTNVSEIVRTIKNNII